MLTLTNDQWRLTSKHLTLSNIRHARSPFTRQFINRVIAKFHHNHPWGDAIEYQQYARWRNLNLWSELSSIFRLNYPDHPVTAALRLAAARRTYNHDLTALPNDKPPSSRGY